MDEQAGRRVEIAGLAVEDGLVMGVHHLRVVRSANVQPIWMRGQRDWCKRGYTAVTVQCPQNQPPRGQAVGAAVFR